jgi:hypothetical protein
MGRFQLVRNKLGGHGNKLIMRRYWPESNEDVASMFHLDA